MKKTRLLSRAEFRSAVFERDGNKCICCAQPAVDAHHLLERRLFKDGGYYLDNGVSLCEADHLCAERMDIEPCQLRKLAGIRTIVLPPGLVGNRDKWGNEVLENGKRYPGPLFHDNGFTKICRHWLRSFLCRSCNSALMVPPPYATKGGIEVRCGSCSTVNGDGVVSDEGVLGMVDDYFADEFAMEGRRDGDA